MTRAMYWRKVLLGLGKLCLAGVCLAVVEAEAARNVVLFIGDGMGYGHLQIGREYMGGPFCFESWHQGKVITTLPSGGVTDSATAATAMATGYQNTSNGYVGTDGVGRPQRTILELAGVMGLRRGIVTTDDIAGATPGGFGAHEVSRNNSADIRLDYFREDTTPRQTHGASLPDVLMGGGSAGGMALWNAAVGAGYGIVQSRQALLDVRVGEGRLLGVFSQGVMASEHSRNVSGLGKWQPHFSDMVGVAMDRLGAQEGPGFFLMAEGALIDKISHVGDIDREAYLGPELAEFNRGVQAAMDWAAVHPEDETLILVTADHETGVSLLRGNQWAFVGTSHTPANVGLFSSLDVGIGGVTVDNTDIYTLVRDFLFEPSGEPDGITFSLGAGGVTLSWEAVGDVGVVSYEVRRAVASGGPYYSVGVSTGTTFTDGGAPVDAKSYYIVRVISETGLTRDSVERVFDPAGVRPRAPGGFRQTQ